MKLLFWELSIFKVKPLIFPKMNFRAGTMEDAISTGYVFEHTTPLEIHGIMTEEEGCGGLAQEIQECALIQNQIAWWSLPGLLLCLSVSLLGCKLGHVSLYWSIIPTLLGFFALWELFINCQHPNSEEQSHALSVQVAIVCDGLTLERAEQCFLSNLSGYDYRRPVTPENARKWYPDAIKWVQDNPELIAKVKAKKAEFYPAKAQEA